MKIEWETDDSQRDHKRQELIQLASQLFRQNGFKNTKLDAIASISKVGKTALYYYFKNKKSIFTAVMDWEVLNVYQKIESSTLNGLELSELEKTNLENFHCLAALESYIETIVEIGDQLLRKHQALLFEYNSFHKLIQSIVKAFKEQNILLLQVILNYGIKHKQIALAENSVDLAAYAIFSHLFYLL